MGLCLYTLVRFLHRGVAGDFSMVLKQIIKVIIFLEAFTASRYVPFPDHIILQIGVESYIAGAHGFRERSVARCVGREYEEPSEEEH